MKLFCVLAFVVGSFSMAATTELKDTQAKESQKVELTIEELAVIEGGAAPVIKCKTCTINMNTGIAECSDCTISGVEIQTGN